MAVPRNKGTASELETAYFQPATFNDCLSIPNHFPNALPADLIHAWTPRECVRKFVENYCSRHACKVIVHLEDNEEHIISSYYRTPISKLSHESPPPDFERWEDSLSHPINYKAFLAMADGTTTVIDKLKDFTADDRTSMELLPGLDFSKYQNESPNRNLRESLGIEEETSLIVYTGGVTSSNREDIRALYLATKLLNDDGYPFKLVKTGPNNDDFNSSFAFDIDDYVVDIGLRQKEELPDLLSIADILVQPGKVNAFNLYRLPSKLPEFLASGKPVITSNANLALRMNDSEECLKLMIGAPREIADQCIRIIKDPILSRNLSAGGQAFARRQFSIETNTTKLLEFYELIIRGISKNWTRLSDPKTTMKNIVEDRIRELDSTEIPSAIRSPENVFDGPGLLDSLKIFRENLGLAEREVAGEEETKNSSEQPRAQQQDELILQEISDLKDENENLKDQVKRLKETASWKVTMPLRALRRKFLDPLVRKEKREREVVNPEEKEEIQLKSKSQAAQPEPPPAYRDYNEFCRNLETKIGEYSDNFLRRLNQIEEPPLISIILPVYNTDEKWLSRSINSVISQIYPNWQLCIADDASIKPHVRKLLNEYKRLDERIEVVFRENNGHISAASNSALEIAEGEFIALLDHDDELASHALARVVDSIRANPSAKLIYSDEDKIDADGTRSQPHFKSDWNPDLILSQNYISHLGVYRTSLVRDLGGFMEGLEGAQDWDLALRVSEKAQSNQIVHIPEVLYHWRSIQGSTASDIDEKNYAHAAGGKAVKRALERRGLSSTIEPVERYYWRVKYELPNRFPRVTIIIPTKDRIDLLKPCIESIKEKTVYNNYYIQILDNESTDQETLEYLEEIQSSDVGLEKCNGPFNFARLNNQAIEKADSEIICMLNNDVTIISEGWLEELVSHVCRLDIGVVGAKLFYPHDHMQHAGIVLGLGGVASEAFKKLHKTDDGYIHRACLIGNYSAVTGACMAFRKSVWEDVGGFNDKEVPNAFGDVDFCLKALKAGFRNLYTPFAELYHHESASRGHDLDPEKVEAFRVAVEYMKSHWAELIKRDPYYNPNLTLEREDFTLAREPRYYSVA